MITRIEENRLKLPEGFVLLDCIDGLEGTYGINRNGDFWSVRRGRLLRKWINNCGYEQIYITFFWGGGKWFKAHRLLAMQFIPNPEGLSDVNHINGIKTDNRVDNLEWLSHSANIKYSYSHLGRVHIATRPVKAVLCLNNGIVYESGKAAALALGCSASNISNCCNGKLKMTKGYRFCYSDKKNKNIG